PLGQVLHRQQFRLRGCTAVKIPLKKVFKFGKQLMVVVLPGDKLPLVKSVGIVEQQLNLRQDNFLRIVVDTQTLLIDLIQYGNEIIFIVGRKMQRLIYRVGEKTVTVDVACQRMTQQKVGMEYKQVTRYAF